MPQSKRRKHIRRCQAQWSRLLAEFETSDTSQRDFCVERGLTYSSFCRWHRRLRTETLDEVPVDPLIELLTLSGLSAAPRDWRVELDLGEKAVFKSMISAMIRVVECWWVTSGSAISIGVKCPSLERSWPTEPGCACGYEPSRKDDSSDCHGQKELAVLLDGDRGEAGRHHPESAGHLQAPGSRSLYVPCGRVAAGRSAPGKGRHRTDAPTLERQVRQQSNQERSETDQERLKLTGYGLAVKNSYSRGTTQPALFRISRGKAGISLEVSPSTSHTFVLPISATIFLLANNGPYRCPHPLPNTESPRVCRRLHFLRGWSNKYKQESATITYRTPGLCGFSR